MRTHKPVSVSLPPELFDAAEKRAAELGFKRATYIQQLILADLRQSAGEAQPPSSPPAANAPAPTKPAGETSKKRGSHPARPRQASKPGEG